MSVMIERVAEAMWGSGNGKLPWPEISEAMRYWYRQIAFRAISAMREPTDAMILAGYNEIDAYQNMIDAALK